MKFNHKLVKDMVHLVGTDKNGAPVYDFSVPGPKVGDPVVVQFTNAVGAPPNRVKAWILSKCETKPNEMEMYKVSFGRKSKRLPAIIPLTSIHGA